MTTDKPKKLLRMIGAFRFWIGSFFVISASPLAVAADSLNAGKNFGFDSVCDIARSRIMIPYSRKVRDLPCELVGLDYDSWRYIAYQPQKTIWREADLPYQVETAHRGYLFTSRVDLNEVNRGRTKVLPFNPHDFTYRDWLSEYRFPSTLGHSGWKLLAKFNDERVSAKSSGREVFSREVASFLGASYFRVLGSRHVYGSSLRGLAVDCAMTHSEEFPAFTQFWLERPTKNSADFRCWALLESERVVGAYEFSFRADRETTVDVRAKLFVRGQIGKLGIAPLTSMWMWGGGTPPPAQDPRPEVHDADGLYVIGTDDSRLWRPLSRPSIPIVNHYAVPGLKAFGLIQRNRDPHAYADSEAYYHRRPSLLIEPKTPWPAGGVELLRLPASHEGIDNIGAFYILDKPPQDGESLELEYRIHVCDDEYDIRWHDADLKESNLERRARFLTSNIRQVKPGLWKVRLLVEDTGTRLESIAHDDIEEKMVSLWMESGRLQSLEVKRSAQGVIVDFEVESKPDRAFELLLRLTDGQRDLTEVWCYRCEP